jgi:8-oxo-dGTP diphosphatase
MRKEYVALILEKDGRILVEKRKMTKRVHAGDIVFPSGAVEPGETKEEAILREMKEELGITLHGVRLVHQEDFDTQEEQRIYWFACDSFEGEIQKNEAEELLWIRPDEASLLTYDISRRALISFLSKR